MKKMIIIALTVALMSGTFALGGEEKLPDQVVFSKAILPSSTMLIGEMSKSVDAAFLVSKINKTPTDAAYAFTSGVSEEKGSFNLGVLLADLKVSLNAGDRDKVSTAVRSLVLELVQLRASTPLVTSVVNMSAAVKAGTDTDAIRKASLPVLEPFIEDFIEKQGKMLYLRIGEWSESARLAALAGEEGKTQAISDFIKEINPAEYFLSELQSKGAPAGAVDSLKTLAQMRSKEQIDQRDIKTALNAVNTLIQIMG